jgi:hypothetical protein
MASRDSSPRTSLNVKGRRRFTAALPARGGGLRHVRQDRQLVVVGLVELGRASGAACAGDATAGLGSREQASGSAG